MGQKGTVKQLTNQERVCQRKIWKRETVQEERMTERKEKERQWLVQ